MSFWRSKKEVLPDFSRNLRDEDTWDLQPVASLQLAVSGSIVTVAASDVLSVYAIGALSPLIYFHVALNVL